MLKLITAVLITALVTAGLTYSATIMAARFKDMQDTIQANAACTDFYAKALPVQGRGK